MSFLRRLLGGGSGAPDETGEAGGAGRADRAGEAGEVGGVGDGGSSTDAGPAVLDEDEAEAERAHEREVAREEAERLDELQQRQLRFAAYAWKPADQGGDRRADQDEGGETDAE